MNLPAVMQALIAGEVGQRPSSRSGSVARASNILYFANAEQTKEYLETTNSGERISCFAITEPGAGSDAAANIKFSAVQDGDDWVLNDEGVRLRRQ